MPQVTEATFPKLYAQASRAATTWQKRYFRLVTANIVTLAMPAAIDLTLVLRFQHLKETNPQLIQAKSMIEFVQHDNIYQTLILFDKIFVILAASITLILLFFPLHRNWFDCRNLAEQLKTSSWRYMTRCPPYAVGDEVAEELFNRDRDETSQRYREVIGLISVEQVPNKPLGEMMNMRSLALTERIALYTESRFRDQVAYYTLKARQFSSRYWVSSITIVVIQAIALYFMCSGDAENKHLVITNIIAVCIASTIGILSWRDFRKFLEHSSSYGITAHHLNSLEHRIEKLRTEPDFQRFVTDAENILAAEHRLWSARIGEAGADRSDEPNRSSKLGTYIQKPVEVKAVRLTADAVIQTLEGAENAKSGNWVVTGTQGEQWPVCEKTFASKYKAVPNTKDRFVKLPTTVQALQMKMPFSLDTSWGKQVGKKNDWLVILDDNDAYVCAADAFAATYERSGNE
ncbi:MAG TPA: DUF4231 domain-containing protein [Planktothrix sp.]|jgi:hypothetical protein